MGARSVALALLMFAIFLFLFVSSRFIFLCVLCCVAFVCRLSKDTLIVHPVWIGNLPRHTTVTSLRNFVEHIIGRVVCISTLFLRKYEGKQKHGSGLRRKYKKLLFFVCLFFVKQLVSIHISVKQTTLANGQTGERTYAFLNLPSAEVK